MDNLDNSNYPFKKKLPRKWIPENETEPIFSLCGDHGLKTSYKLHNPENLEDTLIEYVVNGKSYSLFKKEELLNPPRYYESEKGGNIMGEIAERIAWRLTKNFLKRFSKKGDIGGMFDERFNPKDREGFLVTHNETHVLKIKNYPNLILLEKKPREEKSDNKDIKFSGQPEQEKKFGYKKIKEIDGLFDYRYFKQRHLIALETKVNEIGSDTENLVKKLFQPLNQLYPDAHLTYLHFSSKNAILEENNKYRKIKEKTKEIYEGLSQNNISPLFFTFNESYKDMKLMKEHLMNYYKLLNEQEVVFKSKTTVSPNEINIFNGSDKPHMTLRKEPATGYWIEY